ncbi:MAG: hypothetical protein RIF41_40895 [Polyangiaceae bacterium]
MPQALELTCPKCRQRLTVEVGAFSREIGCLRCKHRFRPGDVVAHDEPLPAIVEDAEQAPEREVAPEEPEPEAASEEVAEVPDEAVKRPPREEAVSAPPRVGEGGTLLLEPAPDSSGRVDEGDVGDEIRGVAAAVVADIGRRLPGRTGPVVTVAVPSVTVLSLLLLVAVDASALRGILAILGTTGLAAVGLVGVAVLLSRRHAAPGGTIRGTLAALSPKAGLAAGAGAASVVVLSGVVGLVVTRATAPDGAGPEVAALQAEAGIDIPVPEIRAVTAATAVSGEPRVHRELVIGEGMVLHVPDILPIGEELDLLIHFAGRTTLVEDSVARAGLRAAVVIANLGEGSGPYMEKLGGPEAFRKLVGLVEERIVELGMPPGCKVRRVAVSSFAAGYGAVLKLVSQPSTLERIDAVLVMEGLYTSYADPQKREVDMQRIAPYVELAKMAKDGDKLFVITHSQMMSEEFATAKAVSDAILDAVQIGREPASDSPPRVELRSSKSLFAGGRVFLEAETTARSGALFVRGYAGKTAGHHVAHLAQMSVTVLPLLVDRWSEEAR